MQKRINKTTIPIVPAPEAADEGGADIARLVEALLDVLKRHEADANDGVLSLLTALVHAAGQVMEVSTPEETEHNRAALLSMLEHGRRFVDNWPQHTPQTWAVH